MHEKIEFSTISTGSIRKWCCLNARTHAWKDRYADSHLRGGLTLLPAIYVVSVIHQIMHKTCPVFESTYTFIITLDGHLFIIWLTQESTLLNTWTLRLWNIQCILYMSFKLKHICLCVSHYFGAVDIYTVVQLIADQCMP